MLPYARHLAASSTPGRTKRSPHDFMRTPRQRRKAFEKEAQAIVKAFEASHPGFPKPQTFEERDAACAVHPGFAAFCAKLDRLAGKWGQ